MGILDKVFGDKDDKDPPRTPAPGATPRGADATNTNFSDVNSGLSAPVADFSDVESTSSSMSVGAARTYTVVAGDSLSKIAQREYGDGSKWKRIWEANRAQIPNPDLIHPGQTLTIPGDV